MSDIKHAAALVRGDRINIDAAIDGALGSTDPRFHWDDVEDGDGIVDATVEGVTTSQECTTVHTNFGVFSVPEDWVIRVNDYAGDY